MRFQKRRLNDHRGAAEITAEVSQVDLHERNLHLPVNKTKGRKARTVYFSSKTVREIRCWLQYKDRYCDSDLLFSVKRPGFILQVSDLEKNFAKYCRRAGIKKRVSPHTLRNNFTKRCLLAGMDIYSLSRILGIPVSRLQNKPNLILFPDEPIILKLGFFFRSEDCCFTRM